MQSPNKSTRGDGPSSHPHKSSARSSSRFRRAGLRSALLTALLASLAFSACDGGGYVGSTLSGGSGTGGAGAGCEPGVTEACYSGPAGTEGVGMCKAGERTCDAMGRGWSSCFDEVTPKDEENCDSPED